MKHRSSRLLLATVAAAAAAASAPAIASATTTTPAAGHSAATPVITSVTFSSGMKQGSSTPLVTIKGSGFGKLPNPSPAGNPQNYVASECDGVVPGYDGLDFGYSLWLNDLGLFQAGSATPGGGGNCIGLVIWKYSATRIQFGFGVVYGGDLQLHNGDHYKVKVGGVTKSGRISITP